MEQFAYAPGLMHARVVVLKIYDVTKKPMKKTVSFCAIIFAKVCILDDIDAYFTISFVDKILSRDFSFLTKK